MSNLFVRKATGLVRSWSVFDAFVYAFFSINFVTLGFYAFSQMYFFGGGMINALVLSAIFLVFEIILWRRDRFYSFYHWLVVHLVAVDSRIR